MSGYTHNGFGLTTSEAMTEKQDMQHLNSKLADYIQRVRELKKAAAIGGDLGSYHDAMKQLENELLKLKALYENELDKLRRKLDEANRERNKLAADTQRMADAQGKLAQEANRARRLEDDLRALEKALAEKERENADLKAALRQREDEAAHGNKFARENEDLKRRLAEEGKVRRDLEEKLKQLMDKHKFDKQMHDNQHREMEDRVKAANEIIKALEKKMNQLNKLGDNLPAALQKLREGTVADMKRFQRETEDALNRNIDALKKQMDDDAKAKDHLARENKYLEDTIRKMAARIAELESQNKALHAENQALREEVDNERARAGMNIAALEKKLKDLQDQLMNHSKEFVNARDAQASLRNEIETYRALLEAEGGRITASRAGSRNSTPAYAKTQQNGLPSVSRSMSAMKTQPPPTYRAQPRGYRPGYNSFDTTYKTDYTAHKPKRVY